jgi:tetratricopeptide (TPR) repeat protein
MRSTHHHLALTLILCLGPLAVAAPPPPPPTLPVEDLSLTALQQRADAGDLAAQFSLGKKYFSAGDYVQALAWFGEAAQRGNAPAQINVGSMFANGMGVSRDYAQAVAWYSKAADQGNPQAQTDLGFMLAYGRGISLDYKQAAFWYRKAADQGYAPAQTYLGMMYADGRGVPEDPKLAVELFRKAAEQGFALAQHNLAMAYDSGTGVPVNHAQAQNWSRKASSGHASDETDTQWAKLDTQTPVAVNPQALPQPAPSTGSIASSSYGIQPSSLPSRETMPETSMPPRGFAPEPIPNSGTSSATIAIPHNYALIFATDDYTHWPHLTNPIPDADAVNQTLTSLYNFHVEEIRNPTDDQILAKLTEYLHRKFEPQDQLLIFFSGHGYFDPDLGKGFLVPANALLVKDDIGHRSLLAHETIMGYVNRIPAKHVVLVLDACFAGTLDRRIADSGLRGNTSSDPYAHATLPELLARKEPKRTRRYITSGGKDFVPDGLPGHHSPFISAFLITLNEAADRKGYLTLDDIQQGLNTVNPEPRWGDIQDDNDPGADFLLLTPSAIAQLTKIN